MFVYIVATSNIGSPLLVGSKTNVRETLVRRVIQEARDQMRPEIFDRFDRVLVFNRLSYEVQIEVGRLHLQWEIEAQARRGHKVTECDAEALKPLSETATAKSRELDECATRRVKQCKKPSVRHCLAAERRVDG
jgi:ATP-dependent Clp protease ATP-binding subunit ClpA